MREIIIPTVKAMAARGMPFKGVLFAGLMISASGPKLIEFNVRFGDPETQVLMMRLKSDLLAALLATVDGVLSNFDLRWSDDAALTVVMAANGYPGKPMKGTEIKGLDAARATPDVEIFHAGTRRDGERLVADGGRVLDVTAAGAMLPRRGPPPMPRSPRSTGRADFIATTSAGAPCNEVKPERMFLRLSGQRIADRHDRRRCIRDFKARRDKVSWNPVSCDSGAPPSCMRCGKIPATRIYAKLCRARAGARHAEHQHRHADRGSSSAADVAQQADHVGSLYFLQWLSLYQSMISLPVASQTSWREVTCASALAKYLLRCGWPTRNG